MYTVHESKENGKYFVTSQLYVGKIMKVLVGNLDDDECDAEYKKIT